MAEQLKGFEWDEGNTAKCAKHGLSREDIESVFVGPLVRRDDGHSAGETRFRAIGKTARGRYAFVVYTIRDARIRPISARYMHAKEIRVYEKEISRT